MTTEKPPFRELAEGQFERIRAEVDKRFTAYAVGCNIGHLVIDPEAREHIVHIGTKILCASWHVGPSGLGSFVQAFCDNDLRGAFQRADSINRQAVYFYCMLVYNVGYIP